MGRHARRKTDRAGYQAPAFGEAGSASEVAAFTQNVATHVVDAADKRLQGQCPYDLEPGSKAPVDPATGKRKGQ